MEKRTDIQIILTLSSNKSVKEIKSRKKNVTQCFKILWLTNHLLLEVYENGAGILYYENSESKSFFDTLGNEIKRDNQKQEEKVFKSLFK
jgi:hypothetical protein